MHPSDSRSRKRWPDWLLLLLLKQNHSECSAVSSDHALGSPKSIVLEWTLGVNTVWPCVVNSRVWWLTGKEKHPSPSYLWCVFGLVSHEAWWWGLTEPARRDTGPSYSFAFWETYLQLKIVTGLSCLHWTVICRGHHLHVREKNNLVIFLCSSVTLCYHGMLDDESRLTQDRHFLWKDFLVAESTECDFLPSPSKCLNFLSFGILINISSSHAASTLTESELEHICKRIRTLIMPGGIFSTHSVAPDAVLSHI